MTARVCVQSRGRLQAPRAVVFSGFNPPSAAHFPNAGL